MTDPIPPTPDDFALVNDLFDGRLDADEAARVRARVESEPALAEAWDDLQRVRECAREHAPQEAQLQPPPDFLQRVRAGIAAEEAREVLASPAATAPAPMPSRRRPGRMLRLMTVACAAAAVILVAFSVHFALRDDEVASTTRESADVPESIPHFSRRALDELKERDASEPAVGHLRARSGVEAEPKLPAEPAPEPAAADSATPEAPDDAPPPVRAPAPGVFGAPGGAVPPGLRTPADPAPPPAEPPSQPKSPAPMGGSGGGGAGAGGTMSGRHADSRSRPAADRKAEAGEIVLVFEAEDAAAARRELDGLLLSLQAVAVDGRAHPQEEARPAGPRGAPKGPPTPTTPAPAPRPTTPPPAAGPAPATPAAPVEAESLGRPVAKRLYRVVGDDRELALRRLTGSYEQESKDGTLPKPRSEGDARSGDGAAAAPDKRRSRPAYLDAVSWNLDAASWKRLESMVGDATWGVHEGEGAAKATGRPTDGEDEEADADGARASARKKKATETDAAKSRAGKRGGFGAKTEAPPAPVSAPASVRVRILIVKPR